MMKTKQYLAMGIICMSALSCHKEQAIVEKPRYEVVKIKESYFLLDNETLDKKQIHDGLAGSLDDCIAFIEAEPGSESHFSKSFQLKATAALVDTGDQDQVYSLIDPEQRKEFAVQEFQNLSEPDQWKLALIPLKKRASHGIAYLMQDVDRAVQDVDKAREGMQEKVTTLRSQVSQDVILESVDVLKAYFGSDKGGVE